MIILVLIVVLGYTYFGGPKVPKILKDYKEMLMGVFVGILLYQFFGVRVEGMPGDESGDESGDELDIQENEPIMSLENYCPSSQYLDSEQSCSDFRDGVTSRLISQYNTFLFQLGENNSGDEDDVKDLSIFFTAEDYGTYANQGKKYTCDSDYQMVYTDQVEGITAQMCLKKNDSSNARGVIHIQDNYHDSEVDTPRNSHLHNKKVVICGASGGAPMRVDTSSDNGDEISFYCPPEN